MTISKYHMITNPNSSIEKSMIINSLIYWCNSDKGIPIWISSDLIDNVCVTMGDEMEGVQSVSENPAPAPGSHHQSPAQLSISWDWQRDNTLTHLLLSSSVVTCQHVNLHQNLKCPWDATKDNKIKVIEIETIRVKCR